MLTWPSCVKYGTAAQQTAQIRHTYSVQPKQQNGGRGAYLQDDLVNRRHREQPFSRSFLVVFYSYDVPRRTYEILSHWHPTIMTKSNIYLYFFSAVALLAGCSFAEDRAVTYLTREVRTLDEKVAGW